MRVKDRPHQDNQQYSVLKTDLLSFLLVFYITMRTLITAGLLLVGLVALAIAMPKSDTETLEKFGKSVPVVDA